VSRSGENVRGLLVHQRAPKAAQEFLYPIRIPRKSPCTVFGPMAIGPAGICCIFLCWNRQAISLCPSSRHLSASPSHFQLCLRSTFARWRQSISISWQPNRSFMEPPHGWCTAYASFGASAITSVWSLCEMEALLTHRRFCSRWGAAQFAPVFAPYRLQPAQRPHGGSSLLDWEPPHWKTASSRCIFVDGPNSAPRSLAKSNLKPCDRSRRILSQAIFPLASNPGSRILVTPRKSWATSF
jgi:hypothetical protein